MRSSWKAALVAVCFALSSAIMAPNALAGEPVPGPVSESEVTTGKVALDPTRGYILLSGAMRQNGIFLRIPDAETRAKYKVDWDKAFAKAQKRHASDLIAWQQDVEISKQTSSKPRDKPEAPTAENFTIDPIEMRDSVSFGPMFVYSKGQDYFSYLNWVKPGTYIYYGPLFLSPQGGMMGTCTCMGSVQFEVKPGVVTVVGNSLIVLPQMDPRAVVAMEASTKGYVVKALAASRKLQSAPLDLALPVSLKAWPSVPVDLRASGKMNNFHGVTVSRMGDIPGILIYKRDRVFDGKTGQEIVTAPVKSRAHVKK